MSRPVLELTNLSCERDGRILFAGLSTTINQGDVVQILGPNGSGKTSLLRMLTGVSPDYDGEIRWEGTNLRRCLADFRAHMLYLGHSPGIKKALTPLENLQWYAELHAGEPQSTVANALAEVGLAGFEEVPCHQLSAGQQRRVALSRLFLTPAPLWILDEPFTAIDVDGVKLLETRFAEHVSGGGTVLLTTHQSLSLPSVKFLNLLDYFHVSGDFDE